MKIAMIIPTFGPGAGGVGSVVRYFAESFSSHDVTVFDLPGGEKYSSPVNRVSGPGSNVMDLFRFGRAISSSAQDIIHQHGIWHPISISTLVAASRGARVVCSPHGMAEPWIVNRGRWKKKSAVFLYEGALWKKTVCFHALTQPEVDSIRATISKSAPIFYIPNGVKDIPSSIVKVRSKTIVYFGRFHKKKGIQALIGAWKALEGKHQGYKLKLVGWGDSEELEGAKDVPNLEVCGPVFDPVQKDLLLSEAKFIILPSFSEGMPMAILEAWAHGTPSIMTPECNLSDGFSVGAAISISTCVEGVMRGLKLAIEMDDSSYKSMQEACLGHVQRFYSLEKALNSMDRMYRWVRGEKVEVSDLIC